MNKISVIFDSYMHIERIQELKSKITKKQITIINFYDSITDIEISKNEIILAHGSDVKHDESIDEFYSKINEKDATLILFSGGFSELNVKRIEDNEYEINYTIFLKGIKSYLDKFIKSNISDISIFEKEINKNNKIEDNKIKESFENHKKLKESNYREIIKHLNSISDKKRSILFIDDDITQEMIAKQEKENKTNLTILRNLSDLDSTINKCFNIAILDIELNDPSKNNGFDILKKIKDKYKEKTKIIMLSGYDSFERIFETYYSGADHFISKNNFNLSYFKAILGLIELDNAPLLLGKSEVTLKMYEYLALYAKYNEDILILGENGTGKEVVAKSIFHLGNKSNKGKLISKNFAGIPDGLFESEMFGYVGGAFTGALKDGKTSPFEEAENGMLFLDEIGDLPINQQTKLLRVIQEREIMPVGSSKIKEFKAKLLFATNKDLKHEIEKGNFRVDFYYRISGAVINIPPLRDRTDDIEMLTAYFCNKFIKKNTAVLGSRFKDLKIDKQSLETLKDYHFPGNIRELERIIYQSFFNMEINNDKKLIFKVDGNIVKNKEISTSQNNFILIEEIITLLQKKAISIKGINKELKKEIIKHFISQNKTNKEIGEIFNINTQSVRNMRTDLKI